eukprot:gene9350-6573_t
MGAAPSRETHRRMLFEGCPPSVCPSTAAASGPQSPAAAPGSPPTTPAAAPTPGGLNSRKNDIVLLPLTRQYFPSPDCPLFVQFHQARCDAAVNYYLRRPGNPGPLDTIPHSHMLPHEFTEEEMARVAAGGAAPAEDHNTHYYHAAHLSYPSREALYRGVVERIEENLYDTDAEMAEAVQFAQSHPNTTMGPDGKKQRPVLPVLCAVAFRTDPSRAHCRGGTGKFHGHSTTAPPAAGGGEEEPRSAAGPAPAPAPSTSGDDPFAQIQVEHGVLLNGALLHVVGCFGFVSITEEVAAAHHEQVLQGGGGTFSGLGIGGGGGGLEDDRTRSPPAAAAPLAAMVYLTKSAGEQNLGRVSYIAASTYYFQMIQAGIIQRCPAPAVGPESPTAAGNSSTAPHHAKTNSATAGRPDSPVQPPAQRCHHVLDFPSADGGRASPSPSGAGPPLANALPPMDTFSFSTLLTNIPILSFLYEMKWRWGYLGIIKAQEGAGAQRHSPTSCLSAGGSSPVFDPLGDGSARAGSRDAGAGSPSPQPHHSAGGLSGACRYCGTDITDEMEMWITPDDMLHGRISKSLAQRLCWSLAERSHVLQERVTQLPSEEESYWRYRGLVDRDHPPPLPDDGGSPGGPEKPSIHPRDVYVMGSNVLRGFDEGDILCYHPQHRVWYVDPSIPLEGVVLAAMRPFSKRARESPSDDPHWVTKLVKVLHPERFIPEPYPLPPPTPEQAAAMAKDPTIRQVAERVGHFYVYQFERDGQTYYLGTVPNFANPNKKRGGRRESVGAAAKELAEGAAAGPKRRGSSTSATAAAAAGRPSPEPNTAVAAPPTPTPPTAPPASESKYVLPTSIAGALFSLLPSSVANYSSTAANEASGTTANSASHSSLPTDTSGASMSASSGSGAPGRPASTTASPRSGSSGGEGSSQLSVGAVVSPAGAGTSPNPQPTPSAYPYFATARKWLLQRLPSMYRDPGVPPRPPPPTAAVPAAGMPPPTSPPAPFLSKAAVGGANGPSSSHSSQLHTPTSAPYGLPFRPAPAPAPCDHPPYFPPQMAPASPHSQDSQHSVPGYMHNTGSFFPYYPDAPTAAGHYRTDSNGVGQHQPYGYSTLPLPLQQTPPTSGRNVPSAAAAAAFHGIATYPPLPGAAVPPNAQMLASGRSVGDRSSSFGGGSVRLALHPSSSGFEMDGGRGLGVSPHGSQHRGSVGGGSVPPSKPLKKKHSNGSFSWDWRNTPEIIPQLDVKETIHTSLLLAPVIRNIQQSKCVRRGLTVRRAVYYCYLLSLLLLRRQRQQRRRDASENGVRS